MIAWSASTRPNREHHRFLLNMDVPFVSSGALNRTHYALVRHIESAPSPEMADSYILKEVDSIRSRLRHPAISLVRVGPHRPAVLLNTIVPERNKRISHYPVILLHVNYVSWNPQRKFRLCFAASRQFSRGRENGPREADRFSSFSCVSGGRLNSPLRISVLCRNYVCGSRVTLDARQHLAQGSALSDTLYDVLIYYQDLESPTTALICLSLENLIMSPSEDVIPAVQSRLQDLLSNHSLVCIPG